MVTQNTTEHHRALPTWVIDTIRDGVDDELWVQWTKFFTQGWVGICASAIWRGWTKTEFLNLVQDGTRKKNTLWHQISHRKGRIKPVSHEARERFLHDGWKAAQRLVEQTQTNADSESATTALHRADKWETYLNHPDCDLTTDERSAVRVVIAETRRRRRTYVTVPCREAGAFLGVSFKYAYQCLKNATRSGFLYCKSPGVPSGPLSSSGRAAIYSLGSSGSETKNTLNSGSSLVHIDPLGKTVCTKDILSTGEMRGRDDTLALLKGLQDPSIL